METTQQKLPIELKTAWIEALRSGQYRQGKGSLKKNDCFCCIGVCGDVAGWKMDKYGETFLDENGDTSAYDPLSIIIGGDNVRRLWEMNDNENKSFPEIANWIEENL